MLLLPSYFLLLPSVFGLFSLRLRKKLLILHAPMVEKIFLTAEEKPYVKYLK